MPQCPVLKRRRWCLPTDATRMSCFASSNHWRTRGCLSQTQKDGGRIVVLLVHRAIVVVLALLMCRHLSIIATRRLSPSACKEPCQGQTTGKGIQNIKNGSSYKFTRAPKQSSPCIAHKTRITCSLSLEVDAHTKLINPHLGSNN